MARASVDTDLEKADSASIASPVAGPTHGTRFGGRTLTLREELDAKRQNTIKLPRERRLSLERTHSIGGTSITRTRVEPSARLAGVYRTLSIHVNETKDGKTPTPALKKADKAATSDLAALDWQSLTTEETVQRLNVAPQLGLDSAAIARRQQQHGKNAIPPKRVNWPLKIASWTFGGFGGLLFGRLLVRFIIVFISWRPLGEPPQVVNLALAVILLAVMLFSAVFNAYQDFSTTRTMASITSLVAAEVLVLRDGNTLKIDASELVPGDVVKLTLGAKVPADLRLIDASGDLAFDRSILTGEGIPIGAKLDPSDQQFMEAPNVALQGTLVVAGTGTGVVVSTGAKTVFGTIARLSSAGTNRRTTLESEVLHFVLIIAALASTVALLMLILWLAWLRKSYPDYLSTSAMLVNLVSIFVAFIPEGLPVCVTTSLTLIANRMKQADVLCKTLGTVETLGAVNVICSDKTGTLTTARMTVVEIVVDVDEELQVASVRDSLSSHAGCSAVAACAAINNDAEFENAIRAVDSTSTDAEKAPAADRSSTKANGDATDVALLRFADLFGRQVEEVRATFTSVARVPFNSKNKWAAVLARPSTAESRPAPLQPTDEFGTGDLVLFAKGGPDVLLKRAVSYLDKAGRVQPLDDGIKARIVTAQTALAGRGRRVVVLCRRLIAAASIPADATREIIADQLPGLVDELTVVGLCALIDPPKHDTADTVAICRRAGIRFAMVTGDFPITAAAIARDVGILSGGAGASHTVADLPRDTPLSEIPQYQATLPDRQRRGIVLSGSDLMAMSDAQWKWMLTYQEHVFARTTPEQKLRIVRAFQAEGCIVGCSGDGVNDAPALKEANVGIAMAGGSEVAMEAADLVLLRDFSGIVTGIEMGRLVFDNLKKTILYLLPAGSFSELWPVIVSIVFGLPQPLSSIQMIIICVITDVLPALSLCYESPEAGPFEPPPAPADAPDLLTRPPRDPKRDRLANWRLLLHAYFFIGLLETLSAMALSLHFGFVRNGVPFSAIWLAFGRADVDPDLFAYCTNQTQSIYFCTRVIIARPPTLIFPRRLVVMQWGNLLATRTRRLSIFQQPPLFNKRTGNWRIFPAMLFALAMFALFNQVPGIQSVFLTSDIPLANWFIPFGLAAGLLTLDELRKLAVRHRIQPFAFLAW